MIQWISPNKPISKEQEICRNIFTLYEKLTMLRCSLKFWTPTVDLRGRAKFKAVYLLDEVDPSDGAGRPRHRQRNLGRSIVWNGRQTEAERGRQTRNLQAQVDTGLAREKQHRVQGVNYRRCWLDTEQSGQESSEGPVLILYTAASGGVHELRDRQTHRTYKKSYKSFSQSYCRSLFWILFSYSSTLP